MNRGLFMVAFIAKKTRSRLSSLGIFFTIVHLYLWMICAHFTRNTHCNSGFDCLFKHYFDLGLLLGLFSKKLLTYTKRVSFFTNLDSRYTLSINCQYDNSWSEKNNIWSTKHYYIYTFWKTSETQIYEFAVWLCGIN